MSNPTEGAVEVVGQEDCLYLNIFTPGTRTTRDLKAVMVWIHGGAFIQVTGLLDYLLICLFTYVPTYLLTTLLTY